MTQTTNAPESLPVLLPSGGSVCVNCGAVRSGPYCAACGQQARADRLTMRAIFARVAAAFDIDGQVLSTPIALFRHPGMVVGDYLRGRTAPYTNPVKHFVFALTLVQLVALWAGVTGEFASGFAEGRGQSAQDAASTLDRFFVLLAAPAVPILAGVQLLVFRRSGLNYAEHLVFALFVSGQQVLLWLPALLGNGAGKSVGAVMVAACLAAATAFYAWAARQLLGGSWPGTLGRSAAALVATAVLYTLVLTALLAAWL